MVLASLSTLELLKRCGDADWLARRSPPEYEHIAERLSDLGAALEGASELVDELKDKFNGTV